MKLWFFCGDPNMEENMHEKILELEPCSAIMRLCKGLNFVYVSSSVCNQEVLVLKYQ